MGRDGEKREVPGIDRALERGRRTFLRYPVAEDEREYTELRRESDDFHRVWNPDPPPGEDVFSHAAFARYLGDSRSPTSDRTLVCRRTDGAIVGAFNLSQIFRGPLQSAYLGYWVGARFARQGYMGDAMPSILRHAFRRLGLHRLEANIQPHNAPSIALARRAGFRKEGYSPRYLKIFGRWCDHERWAILADERRRR